MEDILTVYKQKYDEQYPVVYMDESSKQHLIETRTALPMEPDKPERYDTEYSEMEPVIYLYFLNLSEGGGVLM